MPVIIYIGRLDSVCFLENVRTPMTCIKLLQYQSRENVAKKLIIKDKDAKRNLFSIKGKLNQGPKAFLKERV